MSDGMTDTAMLITEVRGLDPGSGPGRAASGHAETLDAIVARSGRATRDTWANRDLSDEGRRNGVALINALGAQRVHAEDEQIERLETRMEILEREMLSAALEPLSDGNQAALRGEYREYLRGLNPGERNLAVTRAASAGNALAVAAVAEIRDLMPDFVPVATIDEAVQILGKKLKPDEYAGIRQHDLAIQTMRANANRALRDLEAQAERGSGAFQDPAVVDDLIERLRS